MILYKREWNEHADDDWPGQYEYVPVTIDYEAAEQEHRRQLRMGPHVTHRIVDAALGSNEECGAWGGCVLPRGHNMGKADIPSNHAAVGEDKT